MVGRIGLAHVSPVVGSTADGEHPARAVVGEHVPISATVFREGHDAVAANVVVRAPDGRRLPFLRMTYGAPGLDRWHADLVPDLEGMWTFTVEAWSDPLSTWHHAVTVKIDAGQGSEDLANDLEIGARIFDQLATLLPKPERPRAAAAAAALRDQTLDLGHRVGPALDPYLMSLAEQDPVRELVTRSPRYSVWVDRPRSLYGSWYEFFPRSIGAELANDPHAPARPARHGTLKDATEHLDYVARMGFDVVYLPPIHPIGKRNRKGANNSVMAMPWDVGSPWAIGSDEGGHDAVHPDLGTMADFVAFVRRANELGMEVALDYALQAAPDHPVGHRAPRMVHHQTRRDDCVRRESAEEIPGHLSDQFRQRSRRDLRRMPARPAVWIDAGVTIFRVDNPHTKPINFWQWLIATVKRSIRTCCSWLRRSPVPP